MRNIFIIILLTFGTLYFSACSNKDSKTNNLVLIPSADSVSRGSIFVLYFNNDTFNLTDLVVQGSPVENLFASDTFNVNDSFWMSKILVTDYHLKQLGFNLTVSDTTSPYYDGTGNYYVTDNSCSLTDYSSGENKTYLILQGSYINITRTFSPITGTMYLNLYYNHQISAATGNFKIYR